MSSPIQLNDDTFDELVLASQIPVLIDIWAPWCGPCRMIAPAIEEIAGEYEGRLLVGKLNVDENPHIAQRYGVTSIPALLVVAGGVPVRGTIGVQPKASIVKMFEEYLKEE